MTSALNWVRDIIITVIIVCVVGLVVHGALVFALRERPTIAAEVAPTPTLDELFQKHAASQAIDWRLLKAICTVESHLNPHAENPDGLSAGLCQIHCAPAWSMSCSNRFDIAHWPPSSRAQLYDPDYNVSLASQILKWNLDTHGLRKGIAVYNMRSAALTPKDQPFPNEYYVDQVLLTWSRMKQEHPR